MFPNWDSIPLAFTTTLGGFIGIWLGAVAIETFDMPQGADWCGLPALVTLVTLGTGGALVGAVGYTSIMGIDR